MIQANMILVSFAIFLVFWGSAAEAWISSLNPNHYASSRTRTSLLASLPSNEESITTLIVSRQQQHSSRRQWLMEATATGMGLLAMSPGASAAPALKPTATLCDPTVSVWERKGRTIYLLGTAHISSSSAQLAGKLVQETHPDAVFVELDLKRIGGSGTMAQRMGESNNQGVFSISNTDNPESKPTRLMVSPVGRTETTQSSSSSSSLSSSSSAPALVSDTTTAVASSPAQVQETKNNDFKPKQNGFLGGLGAAVVGKGIKSMYQKLGNEGFQPGEEFIVAIKEGQKLGSTVVLGDQDVDVTLRRLAQAIRETDLGRLINPDSELEQSMREMLPVGADSSSSTIKSIPNSASELTQYVEVIKTKENVKKIMALLKNEAPAIYQVMVTERDTYMAAGLNTLNEFSIITAVMGLAHVDGVESNLQRDGWKPVSLRCRLQPV
jgi:TraB/PrgY/gumN family